MNTTTPAMAQARVIGAAYILYFLAALPLSVRSSMVVGADPAATATNIMASESLYRLTIVTDLLSYALYLVLTYLIYLLLRDVNRKWAAIAAIFSVSGCLVQIVSTSWLMVPLILLKDPSWQALALPAREELALAAIKSFGQGYSIALFFFGLFDLLMGLLFAASRMIPRVIAWLLVLAGAGWIVLVVTTLLSPQLAPMVQPVVLPLGALAEVALGLWLLLRGVKPATLEGSSGQGLNTAS